MMASLANLDFLEGFFVLVLGRVVVLEVVGWVHFIKAVWKVVYAI
jgi:hypothetical protein